MDICHTFAHFVWNFSSNKFTVVHSQGIGKVFFDPAFVTTTELDPEKRFFNAANYSQLGIDTFLRSHKL